MAPMKITFTFLIYVAFSEVVAWTIDLPEARKYYFEKTDELKGENKKEENLREINETQEFFDNIKPDSPYNKDELQDKHIESYESHSYDHENDVYGGRYADEYEYMSYMEKKVHGIVHNGSVYLEGLRRALEEYGEMLKGCRQMNFTQTQSPSGPWLPENERPPYTQETAQNPGSNLTSSGNQTGFNQFPAGILNRTELTAESCERASRASEHVRRLAELALWATRELQDKAYAEKYEKPSTDEEEEEMELLLRLAFFLDRLAYFTGFEPEPKDYITPRPARPTTTQPPPFSAMGEVPDDVKRAMMSCLHSGTEPATDRCRYPLQHPEFIRRLFNVTDAPESVQGLSTESYEPKDPSLREILKNPTQRPATQSVQKRDTLTAVKRQIQRGDSLTALNRQIRSIDRLLVDENDQIKTDNPMALVMKYYGKHKVWVNSNQENGDPAEFDVPNHLTAGVQLSSVNNLSPVKSVRKRAIDDKSSKMLHLPENPFQDLTNYVKHKKGVNYINDDEESTKIKEYLNKIRHSDRSEAKILVKNLQKSLKSVQKRSITYEHKFLPERSQNPRQDISYYVKNKPGTDFRVDLVQAAEVRAGLEAAFQNPNIEVVRRYGTNYNPLIPFPLGAGVVRSFYTDLK